MMTELKTYSQRDEQRYILDACKDIQAGRYLDIGAFHPEVFSNTRALFEAGWTGVLVECSPGPLANLARYFYRCEGIAIVAAAVRKQLGLTSMQISDDGLSTDDPDRAAFWKKAGGYYGEVWVPSITIPQILNQFGAFDFVSIDTEGSSVDLLADLLATEMYPRCICVEHDGRVIEAAQMAHAKGYRQVYVSEENLVFSL